MGKDNIRMRDIIGMEIGVVEDDLGEEIIDKAGGRTVVVILLYEMIIVLVISCLCTLVIIMDR